MDEKELKAKAKQLADAGVEIYGSGIAYKSAKLTWERWLAKNSNSVRVFDGRDELTILRERVRVLEAELEAERIVWSYCAQLVGIGIDSALSHQERTERLITLLDEIDRASVALREGK